MNRIPAAFLMIVSLLPGCGSSYFFHAMKDHVENPLLGNFAYEDVYFQNPDGLRLHGLLLHPSSTPRGTVIFFHGNAENVSTNVDPVAWLAEEGYQVFLFDYRGYGKSEGKPSIDGVQQDGLAALDALLALPGVDKDRMAVVGQSMGGAVSVYAAVKSPMKEHIKAMILDGTFASYRTIVREKIGSFFLTRLLRYPLAMFIEDSYSPVRWIDQVSPIPVVILHGDADRTVPISHGEALYEKAKDPKAFLRIQGGVHGASFDDLEIRKKLLLFLETAMEIPPARVGRIPRDQRPHNPSP